MTVPPRLYDTKQESVIWNYLTRKGKVIFFRFILRLKRSYTQSRQNIFMLNINFVGVIPVRRQLWMQITRWFMHNASVMRHIHVYLHVYKDTFVNSITQRLNQPWSFFTFENPSHARARYSEHEAKGCAWKRCWQVRLNQRNRSESIKGWKEYMIRVHVSPN